MQYKTFAEKAQGESHKKHNNKPCQDNTDHSSGDGMYIAIISDGHGSDDCFRSESGSKFAVEAAMMRIKRFIVDLRGKAPPAEPGGLDERNPPEHIFARKVKELAGRIVDTWISKVSQDYYDNPITEDEMKGIDVGKEYRERYLKEAEEIKARKEAKGEQIDGTFKDVERPVSRHAYGATLIAAALTDDYWFGIQIGDGKLTAIYPDGIPEQPVPWDDKCFLNRTTSICDDDAAERARVYVKKKGGNAASIDSLNKLETIKDDRSLPAAIFVNSDGVDDSFIVGELNMDDMVKKFYFTVLRAFTRNEKDPSKGWAVSVKELANTLPDLSKSASKDDISVSGILNMDLIQAEPFQKAMDDAKKELEQKKIQAEQEKQRKQEEMARIAAEEEKKRAEAEAKKKAEAEAKERAEAEAKKKAEEKAAREAAAAKAAEAAKAQPAQTPAAAAPGTGQTGTQRTRQPQSRPAPTGQQTEPAVQRTSNPKVQEAALKAIKEKGEEFKQKDAALYLMSLKEEEEELKRRTAELEQKKAKAGIRLVDMVTEEALRKSAAEEDTSNEAAKNAYKPKPKPGTMFDDKG